MTWNTQSGMEALAARHADRVVLNEAVSAPPVCFQCNVPGKPGRPIGRHDWLCDDCHSLNEKRYRDEYGDVDELTMRLMDGDR